MDKLISITIDSSDVAEDIDDYGYGAGIPELLREFADAIEAAAAT